uniref:verprolin-like n=1 Tax=Podarcis muralis TaxID=64176 RepID=UPI0010A0B860|nr:verprolin-like [Podarcis muralis]
MSPETTSTSEELFLPQIKTVAGKLGGRGCVPLRVVQDAGAEDCARQEQHEHLHLVVRTLNCIFKKIDVLSSQLCNLEQKIDNLWPKFKPTVDTGELKCQRSLPSTKKRSVIPKYKPNPALKHQALSLQPKKICLNIGAGSPRWLTLSGVKKHLSNLLNIEISQCDLIAVLPLNQHLRQQKVMLAFYSPRIPSAIIRQKPLLARYDITPTRVFMDSMIHPLLLAGHGTERTLSERSGVPQDIEPPLPEDIHPHRNWTYPTSPRALKKPTGTNNSLTPPEERELLATFGDLPPREQQEIIGRLEVLNHQLLQVQKNGRVLPTSQDNPASFSESCFKEAGSLPYLSPAPKPMPPPLVGKTHRRLADPGLAPQVGPSSQLLINFDSPSKSPPLRSVTQSPFHQNNSLPSNPSMPELESSYSPERHRPDIQTVPVRRASPVPSPAPGHGSAPPTSKNGPDLIEDPAGHINQMVSSATFRPRGGAVSANPVEFPTEVSALGLPSGRPVLAPQSAYFTTNFKTRYPQQVPAMQSKITDFFVGSALPPKDSHLSLK